MALSISVCIPTMDRPHLIREAIESCFRHACLPMEIVVGDDSSGNATQELVAAVEHPASVRIRYYRNETRLGQSGNVNRLIRQATGTHIALLHDDDLFCEAGLDRLVAGFERHPRAICVYGGQEIVSMDGRALPSRTKAWNLRDRRLPSFAGPQERPLRAALWCQPPNDAYLLDTAVAKRIAYRNESEVGHAVDADFMIRVAKVSEAGSFVLLPEVVSQYRLTPDSIARSDSINGRQDLFFRSLMADPDLASESEGRDELLRRIAPGAILDATNAGQKFWALKTMLSRHYDMPMISRWTGYRMSCILSRRFGRRIKQFLDRRQILELET